jgi:hypothetical protein
MIDPLIKHNQLLNTLFTKQNIINKISCGLLAKEPLYIYLSLIESPRNVDFNSSDMEQLLHNLFTSKLEFPFIDGEKLSIDYWGHTINGANLIIDVQNHHIYKIKLLSAKSLLIESKLDSHTSLELGIAQWLISQIKPDSEPYTTHMLVLVKDSSPIYRPESGKFLQVVDVPTKSLDELNKYVPNLIKELSNSLCANQLPEECSDLKWYKSKSGATIKVACELCKFSHICRYNQKSAYSHKQDTKRKLDNRLKGLKNLW